MEYKVLVADGCFGSRADAERILKGYGMSPFFCERDGEDIIKKIKELAPDAVVMNVTLRRTDGLAVLRRMRSEPSAPKFVTVYSQSVLDPVDEAMALGASYCLALPIGRQLLAAKLDTLRMLARIEAAFKAEHKPKRDIEAEIAELLHTLAIPAHIKGYCYLREAISLSLRSESKVCYATKELYPAVARRFGTTAQRVERAIRHAIETAWDRGDVDVLCGFFGNTIRADRGKPTNSEFIALAAEKLRAALK